MRSFTNVRLLGLGDRLALNPFGGLCYVMDQRSETFTAEAKWAFSRWNVNEAASV
jgi:hypothetical protein